MHRAVAFSLVLHAVLAVGVGLHWHQRVEGSLTGETEVTIEFTTEEASSAEPTRAAEPVAALVETVVPPEPAASQSMTEPVTDRPPAPSRVEDAPAVVEPATPVEPAVTVASPSLLPKPIVSEIRLEGSSSSATNAASIAAESKAKPFGGAAKPGLLAQPLYRKNPEPAYPLAARRRRQEGVVLLAVRVSADGRSAAVTLKRTSGFKLLDDAATGAVMDWEFEPARDEGRAVESEIEVPVRFRLAK